MSVMTGSVPDDRERSATPAGCFNKSLDRPLLSYDELELPSPMRRCCLRSLALPPLLRIWTGVGSCLVAYVPYYIKILQR